MIHLRNILAMILISSPFLCGCQTPYPVETVAEYRPADGPVETPAPYSDVYLLWKWVPAPSPNPHQQPVQIAQAYADSGSAVGFRRINGQLTAIAGATSQPLVEAHYTWQTLPGEVRHSFQPANQPTDDSPIADNGSNTGSILIDFLSAAIDSLFNGDDSSNSGHHGSPNHHDREDHREESHDAHPHKPPASQP